MLQSRDRKKNFLFLFLLIFFLSSINSQLFVKKKESLYNLNSIEVTGLDEQINTEIDQCSYLRFKKPGEVDWKRQAWWRYHLIRERDPHVNIDPPEEDENN